MSVYADVQIPPSGQPSQPQSSPTVARTTAPSSQLPITGPSDVAYGSLAIGLLLLFVGAVLLVFLRHRRT